MSSTYFSAFYPATAGVAGSTVPTPGLELSLPATVYIYADAQGTPNSGQLPKIINAVLKYGGGDVSAATTWTINPVNCSATIDTTGTITITSVANAASISVTGTYKGQSTTSTAQIQKSTSGQPTSTTTYSFSASVANTYGNNGSGTLTAPAPSSGIIKLNANLSYDVPYDTTKLGSYGAFGKWQYRAVGSSTWIDVGPETAAQYKATMTRTYTEDGTNPIQ